MMKGKLKIYSSYIFILFLFAGVIFLVNSNKKSYAINNGINNDGKITSNFKTNYSSTNVNYIGDAGASNETKNNFITPKALKTNSNKVLYLFSKNLIAPGSEQTFEMVTDNPVNINDRGLTYILSHGYNETNDVKTVFTNSTYKSEYGELTDTIKQQYVTQIAIWLYIYKYKNNFDDYCNKDDITTLCDFQTTSGETTTALSYNNVVNIITTQANNNDYKWLNYILKLVEEAETYKSKEAEVSKIDTSNIEFTLSSDKKKVVSNLVTPTSTKNNDNFMYYSVRIDDDDNYGVYLIDKNGNKITNLSNMSGSFKVVIPLKDDVTEMDLTKIKINVFGIYTYDEGYSYRVTKSESEDVNKHPKYSSTLLGYVPTNTVGFSFKARNFTKIIKTDSSANKELAGATLKITNKNDSTKTYEWVSQEEPHYIFLEDGEYTLCEIVAPKGYEKTDECIDFTIQDEQNVKIINMKNSPIIVPNTGLNNSKILLIVGSVLLLIGGLTIVLYKKNKVNLNK